VDVASGGGGSGDSGKFGIWDDYVLGPRESSKNINNILSKPSVGHGDLYDYAAGIFNRIAESRDRLGLADCQKKYDDELAARLRPFAGEKYFNYMILLLFYHRMYFEWETSLRHEPVHILHDAVAKYYTAYAADKSSPEQALIRRFLQVFQMMAHGMRIENALNANCPLGILRHTRAVADMPADGLDSAQYESNEAVVIDWLEKEIEDGRIYFNAVSWISAAVLAWLNHEPDWRSAAGEAIRTGAKARAELQDKSFFYATELDAHMRTLRGMLEFGEAGQCRADFFKVIYCFPFVIHDFSPRDLAGAAKAIIGGWKRAGGGGDSFARAFVPTSSEEVELADVWASAAEAGVAIAGGEETALEDVGQAIYSLYSINFQDIVIHDVADLSKTITLSCEIRLSSLGNHYIRFYAEQGDERDFDNFEEIDGHELHRLLRRASSLCGKEPISSKDQTYKNYDETPDGHYGPRCNLLGIAERLMALFDETLRQSHAAHAEQAPRAEYDFAKTSKVVFSLAELGGEERTPGETAQRESALRRIFMNPIGGPADRLEPWLSRLDPIARQGDAAQPVRNLARTELGEGAQIYTTANTTLIRLPSHAHFICLDYEEMAEFVATLQPVYSDLTARIGQTVKTALNLLKSEDPYGADPLHLSLQRLAALAQKTILDIDSPAIVTNSVYRDYLDDLIRNSSVRQWRETLLLRTASAHEVVNGLAERARETVDDDTAQFQFWVQVGLAVIATGAAILAINQVQEYLRALWTWWQG
jgi:hypothetical protein